jgi:hypothetical protein
MSTTGPLNPEQLTREKTLDEVCVGGPRGDIGKDRRCKGFSS